MGKLKWIGITLIIFLSILGLAISWNVAWYEAKKIKVKISDIDFQPSVEISSIKHGEEVIFYPSTLNITFHLSVYNYKRDSWNLEEAKYIILLEGRELLSGEFHGIHISATTLPTLEPTPLPPLSLTLQMNELAEENISIITNAVRNGGKLQFKLLLTLKVPVKLLGFLRIGTAEPSYSLTAKVPVIGSVKISFLTWRVEGLLSKECHPGEDVSVMMSLYKRGVVPRLIQAEVSAVNVEGRKTLIYMEELNVSSVSGSEKVWINWTVPETLPLDCLGFTISISCGRVEIWSASITPPPLTLIRRYTLAEAMEGDSVNAVVRGTGYCAGDSLKLEIKSELEVGVDLEIEAGTVLINYGKGQNMIIGETRTVRVKPKVELEITIEAYCLDLHRSNPSTSETFRIAPGSGGYDEEVIRLMQSLKDVPLKYRSIKAIQIALWVITDNPTRSEVERVFPVSEDIIEAAAWLLENIGIDPMEKKLFSG